MKVSLKEVLLLGLPKLRAHIKRGFQNNKEPCQICQVNNLLNDEPRGHPLFHNEGNANAKILVVLEAPNNEDTKPRINKLTIEDSEDQTGKFIRDIKDAIEMPILVTNAVQCLPKEKNKNKYPVTRRQLKACNYWLKGLINSIHPQIVVTFGRTAYDATQLIEKYDIEYRHIFEQSAVVDGWYKRTLIATVHPHARISTTRRDKNRKDVITLLRSQI